MDNARLPNAGVMELVDVPDSKSGAARRGGSSPPPGTKTIVVSVILKKAGANPAFFLFA